MKCLICDVAITEPRRLCDNCLAAENALLEKPPAELAMQVKSTRDWKIPDAAVGLTVDHDDFEDVYKVTCAEIPLNFSIGGVSTCTVEANFLGFKKNSSIPFFALRITRVGKDWQWLKSHKARALIDGQPAECDSRINTSMMAGGATLEIVSIPLQDAEARQWAEGEQIRLRVGAWDTTLHPQLQNQLRAIVNKFDALDRNWDSTGTDHG